MKTTLSARRHGFTLIEVMTVVSIVAILAAVAIPELSARLRSAKRAESTVAIGKIERAVMNYFADIGRFPVSTGTTTSTMTGAWNPATLGAGAHFSPKQAGWIDLEVPLDGVAKYFSYQLAGTHNGSAVTFTLTTRADLTGNGITSLRTRTWNLTRNEWILASDVISGDIEN